MFQLSFFLYVCIHKYDAYHKSSQVWYGDVDRQCNLVLHRSTYALCITKDCTWHHSTRESTHQVKRCKQLWSEWLLPGNLSSQTQWPFCHWNACSTTSKAWLISFFCLEKNSWPYHVHQISPASLHPSAPSHQHATFFQQKSSLGNWCVSRTLGDSLSTHEWDCIRYPPPLRKRIQSRHASRACHTWRSLVKMEVFTQHLHGSLL